VTEAISLRIRFHLQTMSTWNPAPDKNCRADLLKRFLPDIVSGTDWLIRRVEDGTWTQPAPIGFYFAKLWYYERLYPMVFTVAALEAVARLDAAAASTCQAAPASPPSPR